MGYFISFISHENVPDNLKFKMRNEIHFSIILIFNLILRYVSRITVSFIFGAGDCQTVPVISLSFFI